MAGVVTGRKADRVLVKQTRQLPDSHHECGWQWSASGCKYRGPGYRTAVVARWKDNLLHKLREGGFRRGLRSDGGACREQLSGQGFESALQFRTFSSSATDPGLTESNLTGSYERRHSAVDRKHIA